MNNILKRIMSLLLALLMVLEVFSPVAVSAMTLLDEEENHNSIMSEPRMDSKSILVPETKPKKEPDEDILFTKAGVKTEPNKETNKLQETPARQKESSTIIETPEKESPAQVKEPDKAIIEAGRQREQKAEDKLNQAVERAKQAEQNAKASENLNLETTEIEKPGYKAWRVVNRIKAVYKNGKLDCQGLLIEVEDFKGNKKTLTYDDILKDKNIIVNKEIKEGLFGSSELIITTPGLRDIKIDVKVENMKKDKDEKSALSLNKDNSNKLEDKENTEEKEGLLDKIKNFFADDEQTKGLEEDAAREDAKLEFSDLDGINKVDELTEEELEAGLTLYQMPTVSEKAEEGQGFFSFFRSPVRGTGSSDLNLEGKKFTIITRYDISNANGPVKKDQSFTIHLDNKLTVKDESTLPSIKYNNEVIATPKYNPDNTITYTLTKDINENIQIPLNIPVDYNIGKITLDDDGTFTVINKVTGIGVNNPPKDLVPQKIDKNGNPAGSIIEPGRDDVIQIVDPSKNYRLSMDSVGYPVVDNGELKGINWVVKIDSEKDLVNDLGMKMNFTLVEGSGLKEIESVTFSGSNATTEDNGLKGMTGIVDSKHSVITDSTKSIQYNIYTPVSNKQAAYVLDISTVLTKDNNYIGAVRSVMNKGYAKDRIEQATPTRVGINNTTTIQGKFTSNNTAEWTITDGACTNDPHNGMPFESRTIEGNPSNLSGKRIVYGVDITSGKMALKVDEKNGLTSIPTKESNPNTKQAVGSIGVYKFTHNVDESTTPHSYTISGVKLSKFQDLYIDQVWNLPDGLKMPEETFKAVDNSRNQLGTVTVNEGQDGEKTRLVTIPNVKYWDIGPDGTSTMVDHEIVQSYPNGDTVTSGDKTYKYYENVSYYKSDLRLHHIQNSAVDETEGSPSTFTVIKVDSKDAGKRIPGATFKLIGANEKEVVTDANGKAAFTNIAPGTYTLKETKAPTGYKLDQEDKIITISATGEISVSGNNADLSQGVGKTETVEHDKFPNWPDYMNAMHYGKITNDGTNNQVEFYLYLKPIAPRQGGGTDRDTRLGISIPGITIKDVTAYSVYPENRQNVKDKMQDQKVDDTFINTLGNNVIGKEVTENGKILTITGTADAKDNFTGRTGYQIYFPKERFRNDWGFLVKVKANIGKNDSANLYYDWLTNEDTANQTNLQKVVTLSKNTNGSDNNPTITIKNESFTKSPIAVTKFADTKDKDGKRNKLIGAEFTLKDANGNVIANKVTTGQSENPKTNLGEADFGTFPPGTYILEETKAPQGYQKSNVYFEVVVNEKGEVTYNPKFNNGSGAPALEEDYVIEKGEETDTSGKAKITYVNQWLDYQENEPGDIGTKTGVWEAYMLESLKYHADITISNVSPRTRFEIQFDPNLDFTQYFSTFPKIKTRDGKEIADPYFNYKTNLLTYVFNDNSKGLATTTATIDLRGIIPSKFYAKDSGTYNFKIKVSPAEGVSGAEISKDIKADYGRYDTGFGNPAQSNYFRDVYQDDKGNWYVTIMSYYNALGDKNQASRTLSFNWLSTNYQKNRSIADWQANGTRPAYELSDVKIYRTDPSIYWEGDKPLNRNMPLSYGIRPERDPYTYYLAYHTSINSNESKSDRSNNFDLQYDKNQIQTSGSIQQKTPLRIKMPGISKQGEGYVIEQTFKIPDINEFNNHWRAAIMSNGNLKSAFANGVNFNKASAEQSGAEIPKYYKEVVGLINKKYTPGQFKITKLNEANRNEKLNGATFSLEDEGGNKIYRSSGVDGIVEFRDLAPGRYTLEETSAPKEPKEFIKSNKKWNVTVFLDGSVKIVEIGILGADGSYQGDNENVINMEVTNKPTGTNFRVYKKDSDGKTLQGAKFKITKQVKEGEQAFTKESTSDENGIVKFGQLSEGTYLIEETEAPLGYHKLNKKWVLVIDANGNKKVYNHRESGGTTTGLNSILEKPDVYWVDVAGRSLDGWNLYDNRFTGWTGNSPTPFKMGTRIVGINTEEKYVIQRYVINPESANIGKTTATIHREKPEYPNMTWYNGDEVFQVFKLNKPVTGVISDIRLAEYGATDITDSVKGSAKAVAGKYGEPNRLSLDLPATDKPLVIDVKVPYKEESGGVGTGMDWTENGTTYWKSDYYEKVSTIKQAAPVVSGEGSIIGSYISDNSLDVTNDLKTYKFRLKKVKKDNTSVAIEGAEFKLTGPEPSTDAKTITTGKDGMIAYDNLKPGTYKLEETKAAPGYQKANTTWTVTISQDGKTFIRDDNASASPSDPSYNIGLDTSSNAQSRAPINAQLYNESRVLKTALYGQDTNDKENSLVFKSEAEKNEGSIKEKIDAIYGTDKLEELYPNGFAFKEIGMAAYSPEISTELGGLEISEENVPEAQRAGEGWQQVDKTKSTTASHQDSAEIQTKITHINKDTKQFKQVFLLDGSKSKQSPIMFNLRGADSSTSTLGSVQVYQVTSSSNIDNIVTSKSITHQGPYADGNIGGQNITFPKTTNKYAVEITTSYTDNQKLGFEGRFIYDRTGKPNQWKYATSKESYNSANDINKETTYKVTPNIQDNGTVIADPNQNIKAGDKVTLTLKPNDGFVFSKLEVNSTKGTVQTNKVNDTEYTFTMPDSDVTVSVYFIKPQAETFSITVNQPQNGSITANKERAEENETVVLKVNANQNYELESLTVKDDNGQTVKVDMTNYTFTMPASNVTVNATFKPTQYNITTSVNDASLGSVTVDKNKASFGEKVTVTVKPKDNTVEITEVKVGGQPIGPQLQNGQYTFKMPAEDVSIEVTFNKKTYTTYAIGVNRDDGKYRVNILPTESNNGEAKEGEIVKFTAQGVNDNEITKVYAKKSSDGSIVEGLVFDGFNGTFTMPKSPVTIYVEFKYSPLPQDTFRATPDPTMTGGNVTITPSTGKAGTVVRLTVNPWEGYTNTSYSVTKAPNGGNVPIMFDAQGLYFEMPASNVTVYANFKQATQGTLNVTIDSNIQNGSVSVNVAKASEGDKVFLSNKPAAGYELQKYTVTDANGKAVPVTGNMFTMPATGVNVSATFGQVGTEIPANGFAQIFNTQTGLELKVYKRDFYKRPLAGGEFTLQKATDENYTKIESTFGVVKATSAEDGKLLFKDANGNDLDLNLQPGYYLLTETQSPSGYKKAQAPWRIHVYEENGQLKAEYQGPEDTPNTFIDSDKAKDKDGLTTTKSGIKYAARMTYINPETKSYVQRIYVDTRGYTGSGKVNIQITPKYKREEYDTPGAPPKTIKEGVKTAYRSTYQISGIKDGEDPSPSELNNILRYYDISYNNVSVVNTARWRPFDWGFDEDQLNLDKGVYYIDVEGFYDGSIIDGKVTTEYESEASGKLKTDANGKPIKKADYVRNDIKAEDLGKIDINIDFYDGERKFQYPVKVAGAAGYNWTDGGSYQDGNVNYGVTGETAFGKSYTGSGKYPNWISKWWTDKAGNRFETGRIYPALGGGTYKRASTSININSIYKSDKKNPINPEGMNITNDEETYNITFSKHGRDKSTEDLNGEEVTRRRLAGAVFKLQEIVGNTNVDVPGSTIASAFNGYFGFRGLKPGRYVLLEEKAPEGYKPINGPLLYFTIETIKTNSGKIVDPETGKVVNIKTISVKFPGKDETYKLSDLSMIGKDGKSVLIGPVGSGVDSKEISIENTKIVDPKESTKTVLLKDLSIVGKDLDENDNPKVYPFSQIKIIPDSSGYVSLEYDKANGVYQYVPEKSTSEKNGKLVDFVTSGTAKNMGKIVNEKPGNGSVTLNKIDQNGKPVKGVEVNGVLEGAKFKLTNINSGAVLTETVGTDGTLKFKGLNIGQYRLEEVESPNGYINNKQVWNFTVGGKDLDPYAGDAPARKEDISSKITLSTDKDSNDKDETYMTVLNPKNDNLQEEKSGEVHPHLSEVMEFTNTYKLDPNIKVNPGDYFTIQLTDNIDLNGIMQGDPGNLDLFADGVGTIAKADYDKEAGTITYTFTDYAKTYQLAKISNKLKAYINLEKVPKGGNQNVGLGIINQAQKTYKVNVVYDSMTAQKAYGGHDLNLGSKIVKYNPETGEFVHYYYINKNQTFSPMCRFYYSADQDVENLQIGCYYLKDKTDPEIADLMPESFGVDESKLSDFTVRRSKSLLPKGDKEVILFEEGLKKNESYIFKVTGKISGEDKLAYLGHGELKISYVGGGYLNVTRFDQVYAFNNDANAKAELTIQAVNPENRIKFMKTDQDGKPLKGAGFQLQIKSGTNWVQYDDKSSGEDGIFEFTQLKPGEYQLVETQAVDGYKKLETPVMEFTVDKLGKIYKKEIVNNADGTTSTKETEVDGYTPIPIVNKKEQIIKFKKVDVDGKPLAGAEFEVWYKKDKSLEYNNKDLKLYQNSAGDKLVLNKDEKAPAGYNEVKKFTTGDDGLLAFKVYDSGYYALKEIKAPKGYIKPKDPVKEFTLIDGSLKVDGEEQAGAFVTEVKANKEYKWTYTWGFVYCYFTDIDMKYNADNSPITYTKGKSNLTLSGLPKASQPTGDKVSDQGISIYAKLVGKDGTSTTPKKYELALSEYNGREYTSKTIDLFALVKELEGKNNDDPITTDKSLVISMESKLYKSTELDIGSNIVIGDKVKENRSFHIGTKGEENVDHSYSFTTKGEVTADPIDIVNNKGEYPWTGGMGTLIFTVSGLILMSAAAYVYSRKRRASYDD
ncbi:SpaA isopeptide-forming pilin-related protein [Peptoniphilus grossensis]|uniref:SpaA isopeptide-forming pilin-related protein n=1 Tax=Peptoniphilus grossensis TaxID=1465756 RepID=A0ABU7XC04_9FIRM